MKGSTLRRYKEDVIGEVKVPLRVENALDRERFLLHEIEEDQILSVACGRAPRVAGGAGIDSDGV